MIALQARRCQVLTDYTDWTSKSAPTQYSIRSTGGAIPARIFSFSVSLGSSHPGKVSLGRADPPSHSAFVPILWLPSSIENLETTTSQGHAALLQYLETTFSPYTTRASRLLPHIRKHVQNNPDIILHTHHHQTQYKEQNESPTTNAGTAPGGA